MQIWMFVPDFTRKITHVIFPPKIGAHDQNGKIDSEIAEYIWWICVCVCVGVSVSVFISKLQNTFGVCLWVGGCACERERE